MHVLRLGLGNARAVSAFVTVCKFGRSLIRRENVCANFRVFVHVTSPFACGSCRLLLLLVQLHVTLLKKKKSKVYSVNDYGKAAVLS